MSERSPLPRLDLLTGSMGRRVAQAMDAAHRERCGGPAILPPPSQWYVGIEWEPQLTLLNYPGMPVFVEYYLGGLIASGDLDREGKTVKDWAHVSGIAYNTRLDRECVTVKVHWRLLREDCARASADTASSTYGGRCVGVDEYVNNVEIRSRPSRLADLQSAIDEASRGLGVMIRSLARHVGPVGVFLPQSVPPPKRSRRSPRFDDFLEVVTKHVSLSFSPDWLPDKTTLRYRVGTGDARLHLNVPYQFTDYCALTENVYDTWGDQIDHYDWRSVLFNPAFNRAGKRLPIFETVEADPTSILLGYSMTGETYIQHQGLL